MANVVDIFFYVVGKIMDFWLFILFENHFLEISNELLIPRLNKTEGHFWLGFSVNWLCRRSVRETGCDSQSTAESFSDAQMRRNSQQYLVQAASSWSSLSLCEITCYPNVPEYVHVLTSLSTRVYVYATEIMPQVRLPFVIHIILADYEIRDLFCQILAIYRVQY